MPQISRVFTNIDLLITLDPDRWGQPPLAPLRRAAMAVEDDEIRWVGPEDQLGEFLQDAGEPPVTDLGGAMVLPGLVDCHTHTIFGGSRQGEFAEKLRGVPYLEIAARGGGIHGTVRATRAASDEELLRLGRERLDRALAMGITTVEIKSGYGLSVDQELRILRLARRLDREHPVDVVTTLLAAHEVPKDVPKAEYLRSVLEEAIPRAAQEGLATFCDVFCEQGVFNADEAELVLRTGLRHGLLPKIHAEQLSRSGGSQAAARVGAVSADHLEQAGEEEIQALADAGVIAVLLPGCNFFMGLPERPPARRLIEAGVPVALSTDFNPGSCMTQNLPLIATMGCTMLRMTPEEALAGITHVAARALRLGDHKGVLRPGAQADWVISPAPDPETLVYEFGRNHVVEVYKGGQRVHPA